MKGRSYQPNFTMGQVSDELGGRVDLQVYADGVGEALNVVSAVTGPARRRAGFLDMGAPKLQARKAGLVPFRRSIGDNLQLEFGDRYLRIWNSDGSPVLSGGAPYEIVSPYAEADVVGLRWLQSNDVIYLTHLGSKIRPYALQRRGPLDWSFVVMDLRNGPWRPENVDNTFTLSATDIGGAITLTASKPLFDPLHVGSLFRLRESGGNPSMQTWTPGTQYHDYELVLSDGKIYRSAEGVGSVNKSGTTPPLHDFGVVSDGGRVWEYLHDGAGIVRIDAVIDSQTATGQVLAFLPTSGTGPYHAAPPGVIPFGPTTYWSEGAFSTYRGWPRTIQESGEERIVFGGTASEPGGLFTTRTGGFGPDWMDFKPGLGTGRVTDDDAIRRTVGAGGDGITWIAFASAVMIGTAAREYALRGSQLDDPVTPSSNSLRRLSSVGGAQVPAIETFDGVVFVPLGGRGLNQIRLGVDQAYADADLGIFAEDLCADQLVKIVWAPHPDKTIWAMTAKGGLLSIVYDPRQNVFGWQRHVLGGGFTVEDMSVLNGPDGRDTLWLNVVRTKNDQPQRRVWRQAPRWRKGAPMSQVFYLDAAGIYAGAAQQRIGGLGHLEGETVRVFGDLGRLVFDAVVTGGQVDCGEPVSNALIGLRYTSRTETLPLDLGGPGGTVGQLQRVTAASVYLADFVTGSVSFGDGPLEAVGGFPWGTVPQPGAYVHKADVGNVSNRRARVAFQTDDVWPATLLAIRAEVNSEG